MLPSDALSLAAAIARREVTSEAVVAATLDAIEAQDPALSAFVTVLRRPALREARAADLAVARGAPLGRFHGVPIGVKDLDPVAGSWTRFGSRAFRWFWSPTDGPVARRLRAAGFVIVGKTATSEFGAMPVTEPDIHPPTRNPWDRSRSAGGSSGGAAAAVAAGLLPIAQGSDGGGSIRIPAAFCGLYGYKPSRRRVPPLYGRADPFDIAYVGALARTVDDSAALVDVLAGRPLPDAPPLGRLRVRTCLVSPLGEAEPEVAAAVERVAAALAGAGHGVEPGAPMAGDLDEFLPIWQRQLASVPALSEGLLQPVTRWLRAEGRRHDDAGARARHAELAGRVHAWFGDADLWLTPTVLGPAPPVGAFAGGDPREAFRAAARIGAFTAPFNLAGHPAASVPAGWTREGLPVGVQVVGRPDDDATVLAVSRLLERALPWADRRPPQGPR